MENNKQPEKKVRLLDTEGGVWGLIILLYGIIFLLIYIANINSVKECDVSGCSNTCDKDERYCKDHKHHDLYITWNVSTNTSERKNVDTTKSQSGVSKKSNRTNYYTGDIYSAEKYNNPDDFADDWEDDFDSWEDAYEYWEDAME